MIGRAIRMIQRGELAAAITTLRGVQEQLARRHSNPPDDEVLGISRYGRKQQYCSQAVGEISREAHAILYRHVEDGKQYRHDFERPTSLVTLFDGDTNDVLITSPDGSPIWQDF